MDAIETRGFNEKKWQSRRTNLFIRIARDESIETKMIVAVAAAALLLLLFSTAATALDPNLDQFSYNDDTVTDDVHNVFGPKDWGEITCPDLENCLGWPDKWEYGKGWDLGDGNNFCVWCPDEGDNSCGVHHESPINLLRARALSTSEEYNMCIDIHWMQYHDSTCTFERLRETNAFRVDRHALRVIQPIKLGNNNTYELDCKADGKSSQFGVIDFSKGFSAWWYLSHIDFHVPSEHVQEGKRYDAELQMYHFYSITGEEAGIDNEMGTVAVFMNAYDDADDYDVLNRLICAWREDEEKTRLECGLDSVATEYPGCFRYTRGQENGETSTTAQENARTLRTGRKEPVSARRTKAMSAHDLILKNHRHMTANPTYKPVAIQLSPGEHNKDMSDFDWDSFITEQYEKDNQNHHGRELLNYDHVGPWFNYFAMLGVRTEYYFRYSGTQTIPPCYGNWFADNNRKGTNHWRAMKDPLRISKRQLAEMHRLLRERIAPSDDPVAACKPDTAAKIVNKSSGEVDVARPLQSNHKAHYTVFCECENWESKWAEDRLWCQETDILKRFYDRPYNFETAGY